MSTAFEPQGIRFFDNASNREMLLVEEGHHAGWLCYRHPEGQWVTLRQATEEERAKITRLFHDGGPHVPGWLQKIPKAKLPWLEGDQ